MFENTLQTNGQQTWKWVTISGRVFVDNDALDQAETEAKILDAAITRVDVFEELARDRLIEAALPHSDEPFKFDSIDFPA